MAVYFVCRSGDYQPTCLSRRQFDDATVVEWFRRVWAEIEDEDEAADHAERVLGEAAFLGTLFQTVAREGLPRPDGMEDVAYVIASDERRIGVCYEEHC